MGRSGDGKRNILWGWPKWNFIIDSFILRIFIGFAGEVREGLIVVSVRTVRTVREAVNGP